jgi:DNA-binding NarL/FixJ family response regulator
MSLTGPPFLPGRLVGTCVGESESQEDGGKLMALILFVEYHNVFRQSASLVMDQEQDLKVAAQGGSVAEGRQKMAEGGIDTAIVDIPLPDEGAVELVRELHEANPSIPVLVLTHLKDHDVYEEFLKAGAAEVLSKEHTVAEMFAAVRKLGGN